jgi:hypothetical protein
MASPSSSERHPELVNLLRVQVGTMAGPRERALAMQHAGARGEKPIETDPRRGCGSSPT